MAGPPITITCECGARHDLAYGERWTCEQCGRSYDSNRIPAEEYDQIRKLQLRYRVLPVAVGLVVLALAMLFTLTGNVFSVFFLLPVGPDRVVRLPAPGPPQALPRGDREAPALGPAGGVGGDPGW